MERFVSTPGDVYEVLFGTPWPIAWGFYYLVALVLLGLATSKGNVRLPWWLLSLPAVWVVWQLLSAMQSMAPDLSVATSKHLAATAACFYLGVFCLSAGQSQFWVPLTVGFILVLAVGFSQQLGGLDETRRFFFLYVYPKLSVVPPEYLRKISSNRIFSTLFYPNSLAGVLLLLTAPVLTFLAGTRALTASARAFLMVCVGIASVACLYWSGSKAGWLLFLGLCLLFLLRLPLRRRLKLGIIMAIVVVGLTGFFWRYSSFFRAGATSVVARFDYWEAALKTARAHPFLGTGPGTFGKAYNLIKRPESEPTRLTHNDYLQQASDSGFPGFLVYASFVAGALFYAYPRARNPSTARYGIIAALRNLQHQDLAELHRFAVWAGLLVWFLQGFVEFGLYIPGNAWPAFVLLGWLLGSSKTPVDKPKRV